ncbi:5-dehydro-4-deoxy-D-glucuronate isomerase [Breznakiella homolactica]|uniref:4-deoxy-L-threo-5-hexosulose-uronate ketol-isomerase n=1 Tax=Breznakiella homolactica TaxID=2798577 RepID=A0A7T7XR12_9SPIR|nr:5-dehydro-4-deoxy-D-glucuronate isomerase [Breznakiella homolactica]QQO10852.1 5-dehydro-4-deoxy-D-glucuronate isomerase [Breznakiella homolactica]
MKLDIRYGEHPGDAKHYDTETMRNHFLFDKAFIENEISLCYTHSDRVVFGGACPAGKKLRLEGGKDFGSDVFLDRRELGIICIAGNGTVSAGGTDYPMKKGDGMYIGKGVADVEFSSGGSGPAKFYLVSAPAHTAYPTVFIPIEKANPRKLGDPENVNVRTIYQYVHPAVCQSCQLVMGMTILEPGSVWNTMPCHTHERRMEVYFYFDMKPGSVVFHLHGQPQETRHIVMNNEQCVISPSWSIHSGVGTGAYTFIWGMAGENQTFDDMDHVAMEDLR